MKSNIQLSVQLKYYQFDWLDPKDDKWKQLTEFIKANTNIVELWEPVLPDFHFHKEKINIHKYAELKLNDMEEIYLSGRTNKPIIKYLSFYDQQEERINPLIFYQIPSNPELIDYLMSYKDCGSLLADDVAIPSFYADSVPLVWYSCEFINIALTLQQKEVFIQNGFSLRLKENQSYPTQPIHNFNEDIGIKKTIEKVINFGNQQREFECFQSTNTFLLPNGQKKESVIGEFYSFLFLKHLYPEPQYTVVYSTKSEKKNYDILVRKKNSNYKKIQVKTVSTFSKTRLLTQISNSSNFDELLIMSLNMNLFPFDLWVLDSHSLKNYNQIRVPGIYFYFNSSKQCKSFTGSKIFQKSQNLNKEFYKLMREKYLFNFSLATEN